jgi:hypothetical protein
MRTYPRNSPQAAARIVALAMICDGHVCRAEVESLQNGRAAAELGLGPDDFSTALQTLCEDLLQPANALGSLTSCLDDAALVAMVDEIDDPSLRAKVVGAVQAAVAADRHLSDGEQVVLGTLRRRWGDVAFGRTESLPA